MLFTELDAFRNGETDHHHVAAIAKMSVQIIAVKRLAAVILRGDVRIRPVAFSQHGLLRTQTKFI